MLMGTYYNSIDAKNRMIVPSEFREELGYECVITRSIDRCLTIYSMEEWNQQMEKISRLPESDESVRMFIRYTYANARKREFDKQGRIIIPPELIRYAGIEKELVTMGVMKRIEIWSREIWETPENAGTMDGEDFAAALKKYNF